MQLLFSELFHWDFLLPRSDPQTLDWTVLFIWVDRAKMFQSLTHMRWFEESDPSFHIQTMTPHGLIMTLPCWDWASQSTLPATSARSALLLMTVSFTTAPSAGPLDGEKLAFLVMIIILTHWTTCSLGYVTRLQNVGLRHYTANFTWWTFVKWTCWQFIFL